MIVWWVLPIKYKVELDLNITRIGRQSETMDYSYDEFYRLQADERFADTVVRWLGSAIIKEEISSDFQKLKARRLSSQMISVSFLVLKKQEADIVVKSIDKVLNEKTAELNRLQKSPSWFKVLVSRSVVTEYKFLSFEKLIIVLVFLGFFAGFWGVFVKHYLK